MNLESRARRAAASLKASVAGLAAPAGAGGPAPSHRRLVGGLAIGGALAAAMLLVAVLVLPSSGDPQPVAGGDLLSTTTTGAAVIDGAGTLPGTTLPGGPAGNYPDHQGPFGPDRFPGTLIPGGDPGDGQSGQAADPGDTGSEGGNADVRPGFWASQAYGCSAEEEPAELLYGGGDPGDTITLSSPFGSATAVVGEDGYWEASLAFSGAAYDEPFVITVDGGGESWELSFVVTDPANGDCTPPVQYWFSAYQLWGCSVEEPPSDLFYGSGTPGDLVTLTSPYGSATVVVDEAGWWEIHLVFEGAPLGEPFEVVATAGSGEAWPLSFTATDPENGECVPPIEYWFSAYQGSGCSVEATPTDYFYGTGFPGDVIEITSPYGSASAVVDDWGWWEATIVFEGAPYDEPFGIDVTAPSGEVWSFTFIAPDPATGSCWFFAAYQGTGCSVEEPPSEYFWGTGDPGDLVELTSPYGSAEAVIDEWGYWEATITFDGAPLGETFTIEVAAPDGSVWAFPFIVADPEQGECWGVIEPCPPGGDCDGGAWNPDPVYIDSVDLILAESSPVQVSVLVEGFLPTPCHTLGWGLSEGEGGLHLDLYSLADPTGACPQVLEGFTEVIDLGAFEAGSYVLFVNGVEYPFTV